MPRKIEPPNRLRQLDGLTNHIPKGQDAELRLEVVTIFYFSPLGVKIPNKALKTVNWQKSPFKGVFCYWENTKVQRVRGEP